MAKVMSLSSERATLAAAIVEAARLEGAVATAREAVARAREMAGQAEVAVTVARASAARARAARTSRLARAATAGERPASDGAIGESRVREAAAADELDAARDDLAEVEAELADIENAAAPAEGVVAAAVGAVLATAAPALLGRAQQLQAELIAARSVLVHLIRVGAIVEPPPMHGSAARPVNTWLQASVQLPSQHDYLMEHERHPAVMPWREAGDALRLDASAPLPTDGPERRLQQHARLRMLP